MIRAPRIALSEVAEFINGVAFKPKDWTDDGLRIIRIQNLTDNSKPYNRTTRTVDEKFHVQQGDILVSWSATLGVFVWNHAESALLNQHIFRVIPKSNRICAAYLRQMLIDALGQMGRHVHGATMKHVNRKEFLSTTIPLPPLPEQKRIAGILDAADALRAKRRESLALLDNLLQSTFLQMFGDPVTNPMGWDLQSMDNTCEIITGFAFPSRKFMGAGSGVALCRGINVAPGRIDWKDRVDWSKAHDYKLSRFELSVGDIILAMDRPWISGGLKIAVATGSDLPALLVQRVARIRATDAGMQKIILMQLRNAAFKHHCNTTETTIPHISPKDLRTFSIIQPPPGLRQRFALVVELVEHQKARMQIQLRELDRLFASLQHRAFNGEL